MSSDRMARRLWGRSFTSMNYGNPMIGLRAVKLPRNASLVVWQSLNAGACGNVQRSTTQHRLWYDNSNGAAEIAVNQGAQTTSLLS